MANTGVIVAVVAVGGTALLYFTVPEVKAKMDEVLFDPIRSWLDSFTGGNTTDPDPNDIAGEDLFNKTPVVHKNFIDGVDVDLCKRQCSSKYPGSIGNVRNAKCQCDAITHTPTGGVRQINSNCKVIGNYTIWTSRGCLNGGPVKTYEQAIAGTGRCDAAKQLFLNRYRCGAAQGRYYKANVGKARRRQ